MNFFEKLTHAIDRNQSLLCAGLDPVPAQLPTRYRTHNSQIMADLLRWNLSVIEETCDLVCTYKPNIAFYEALGQEGYSLLKETLAAIPREIPVLLDAKRGDMGPTAEAYARACFEVLGADAVTLNPYLGRDSIEPFAAYPDRGLFVLCHTSNPGAEEFQELAIQEQGSGGEREREGDDARSTARPLYLKVAEVVTHWSPNIGLVVGATYPEALRAVRRVTPDAWFLVPGIGTQGGEVDVVVAAGLRSDGQGLIINASRSIAQAPHPREAARQIRDAINQARWKGAQR